MILYRGNLIFFLFIGFTSFSTNRILCILFFIQHKIVYKLCRLQNTSKTQK